MGLVCLKARRPPWSLGRPGRQTFALASGAQVTLDFNAGSAKAPREHVTSLLQEYPGVFEQEDEIVDAEASAVSGIDEPPVMAVEPPVEEDVVQASDEPVIAEEPPPKTRKRPRRKKRKKAD